MHLMRIANSQMFLWFLSIITLTLIQGENKDCKIARLCFICYIVIGSILFCLMLNGLDMFSICIIP
jgi:hypothetical protein